MPSLLDHARRYSSSGSLSMRAVQSPDLASRHDSRMFNDRAERGHKGKDHDRRWEATLANIEAHKQRMSGQQQRIISGRHQQETQRLRASQSELLRASTLPLWVRSQHETKRQEVAALLGAIRRQQEADEERATTASEESAEQRRRRFHNHREYLARLRRDAHDRERAALRAIALKDETCRLAQERRTPALTPSLTLLTLAPTLPTDPDPTPEPEPEPTPLTLTLYLTLAQERAQELTRQKVQRVKEDLKVYEGRRKQSLDHQAKMGEQRLREMSSHAEREALKEERLREHQARKELASRERGRQLDEQIEAGVRLAHETVENRREDHLGKIQMMSARSEQVLFSRHQAPHSAPFASRSPPHPAPSHPHSRAHPDPPPPTPHTQPLPRSRTAPLTRIHHLRQHLESYRGHRAALASERHSKYEDNHSRAIRRRNDNHNAREAHIFATMARKQARMAGLSPNSNPSPSPSLNPTQP